MRLQVEKKDIRKLINSRFDLCAILDYEPYHGSSCIYQILYSTSAVQNNLPKFLIKSILLHIFLCDCMRPKCVLKISRRRPKSTLSIVDRAERHDF